MPRLIPTIREITLTLIREIFTNGPFKIYVSATLLALHSNRVARTPRVFKIGIEREIFVSVEARVYISIY